MPVVPTTAYVRGVTDASGATAAYVRVLLMLAMPTTAYVSGVTDASCAHQCTCQKFD